MSLTARAVVDQFWDRVWLHADIDGAASYVADDVVFHLFGNTASGIEEWKGSAAGYFAAFPDFRAPMEFAIAEGDTVAVRWRGSGTHRGELGGIAPTGIRVEITGVAIFRIEAGEIAEIWSQPDQMGMLRQIGASQRGIAG